MTNLVGVRAAELGDEEQVSMEPQPGHEEAMKGKKFEMGPEQIERMLARIRQTNPQKADELVQLQEKDPNAFKTELRKFAREQFVKQMKEQKGEPEKPFDKAQGRWQQGGAEGPMAKTHGPAVQPGVECEGAGPEMMRGLMKERSDEYVKWLKENYPDEATKLEQLKGENPEQYMRAMGICWKKYGRIYQAKDNPQLVTVLKEQMALREKRTELLRQIKATTDEKQKKTLTGDLEVLVGQQFDLIVKRKQIAYEDLTKKLAELQKNVDQRKIEVEKWKSADFKKQQVKQRVNELINETEKFEWE
jgi:hypothetical protein